VKPGGTIVYSTCSLEPEENNDAIQSFLGAHPDFTVPRDRSLIPFRDNIDGAYAAMLVRRA
jgi:16S rRNA (cytosine967-C5)-methyltransferase